jgi:hypothetical protein
VPDSQRCGNIRYVRQRVAAENKIEGTNRVIQGFSIRLHELDVANIRGIDGLRGLIQHTSGDIDADYGTLWPD